MRCSVRLEREGSDVVARCAEFPECLGRGSDRAAALQHLRASVVFWLETCPCDQTADAGLVLDVIEDRTAH